MTEDKIKQIINETVTTTVLQLKAAGLLGSDQKTAFEKTEALLWQYPKLKDLNEPYARRVVKEVEACLAAAKNEPYVKVISLYYFAGLTNVACAMELMCDERTCRRYRRKLVQQFSVRLASDEFIRELLL